MQNLFRWYWRTKAGTRVIGVSIERSRPQGHHTMDEPHPLTTPTPKTQNHCYMQNLSRRVWRNQGRCEGDKVSMERSWPQGHHTMDGPTTNPSTPHAHLKNAKSMLYANLVPKSLEKPRQVRGWLGCLWKGPHLRVITQWMDPTLPHQPSTPTPKNAKSMLYAKLVPKSLAKPRQVWGGVGCLWKGLDLRVTTQWTDQPHNHHSDWPTHVLPAGASCKRPKAALLRVFINVRNILLSFRA